MLDGLTPRQREIVSLIEQGRSNKEIASLLDIGVGTVKQHVAALFRRLNVASRAQAVAVLRGLTGHETRAPIPEQANGSARSGQGGESSALAAECRVLSVAALHLETAESLAQAQGSRRLLDRLDELSRLGRVAADRFKGQCFERTGLGVELRFGFAKARSDDAARAVRAARFVLERLTDDDGEPILKAGVASGVGVILAQSGLPARPLACNELSHAWRLAHSAPNGRILACEATQRLTSSCLGYETSLPGMGLGRAALARAEIAPEPPAKLPLPRQKLLQRLLEQTAKSSCLAVVEAASDLGRTTLATTLAESLSAAGGFALYLPMGRQALDPVAGCLAVAFEIKAKLGCDAPPALRAAVLDDVLSANGLTDATARRTLVNILGPQIEQTETDALLSALTALSQACRLALIVDDVDEAPPGFLDWILALRSQAAPQTGVFLFGNNLAGDLRARLGGFASFEMPPLSDQDMSELILDIDAERQLDDGLARAVIRQAQGRPGACVELVQALLSRLRGKGDANAQHGLPMPLRLYAALIGEMDVDADVKEALRLAAVLGRSFGQTLLARFWPKGQKSLDEALKHAVKAELLTAETGPGGTRFTFSRPLLREAAALSWLSADRAKLRARVERTRVRVGSAPLAPVRNKGAKQAASKSRGDA